MEIKQCARGHFYDADVNSTCPVCLEEMRTGGGYVQSGGNGIEDCPPTEAAYNFRAHQTGETNSEHPFLAEMGMNMNRGDDIGQTSSCGQNNQRVTDYQEHTAPVEKYKGMGAAFSPVTGWLVCTEGPAKGKDYRIQAGYNYIGRSESMTICIPDQTISRERHAMIGYDHKNKVFKFAPYMGENAVEVNGEMIMGSVQLSAYDVLTIGNTKLLFVPLCGERFSWDE